MKSPFSAIAIRLTTNLLVFVTFGMIIHVRIPEMYPKFTVLLDLASIAIIVLGGVYLYVVMWKYGERDRNLVKYNYLTYQPKRGYIAGAIAVGLPLILLVALAISNYSYVKLIYITAVILVPLVTGIGYTNGHKLKTIGINIIYKNKKAR